MKAKTKKKSKPMTVWAAFELLLETGELNSRVGPYDTPTRKQLGEAVERIYDGNTINEIKEFLMAFDQPKGGPNVH